MRHPFDRNPPSPSPPAARPPVRPRRPSRHRLATTRSNPPPPNSASRRKHFALAAVAARYASASRSKPTSAAASSRSSLATPGACCFPPRDRTARRAAPSVIDRSRADLPPWSPSCVFATHHPSPRSPGATASTGSVASDAWIAAASAPTWVARRPGLTRGLAPAPWQPRRPSKAHSSATASRGPSAAFPLPPGRPATTSYDHAVVVRGSVGRDIPDDDPQSSSRHPPHPGP